MYFSASHNATVHCVGAATSTNIRGPFNALRESIACPVDVGGAIDPSGYRDSDGTYYVAYKIDGNSVGGSGGKLDTPLMLQRMEGNAVTPDGSEPTTLLHREAQDGPNIEAPSIAKNGDTYFLTFSSNSYDTTDYDVNYATAPAVTGPYTRAGSNLLVSGDDSVGGTLAAPGGSDFNEDGSKILFHAFQNGVNISDGRSLWAANLIYDGSSISIA